MFFFFPLDPKFERDESEMSAILTGDYILNKRVAKKTPNLAICECQESQKGQDLRK